MSDDEKLPANKASGAQVDAFLRKVAATPVTKAPGGRGRLLFAMDATASRQPTWDRASRIQAEMFSETKALGGLDVQLAFYRGFHEFKVSKWQNEAAGLLRLMTSVACRAGETQITKVLQHAANETKARKVDALVFIGDCVEEDVDRLGRLAGELGLLGLPAFLFHEGSDPIAEYAFREIARLTGGACCAFDASSPTVLRDLLSAVAVYAAGGRPALEDFGRRRGGAVARLTHQVGG